MSDLDLLSVEWLVGDDQDVISVRDERHPDAWPVLELSPADAITFGMRLIEQAKDALHAYYPDGRAAADGRLTGAAVDYIAVDEPIPLLPAEPPRSYARDAQRGYCPRARWRR